MESFSILERSLNNGPHKGIVFLSMILFQLVRICTKVKFLRFLAQERKKIATIQWDG